MVAPRNTRTFNSQSGFSLRIEGTKKTTYLYLGDQVCICYLGRSDILSNEKLLTVGHELPLGKPVHLVADGDRRYKEITRACLA
jgi:hypothetical protein